MFSINNRLKHTILLVGPSPTYDDDDDDDDV